METAYRDITAELDAREVLRYLNELGIYNISGEVLKYFITDLKKLIKYDLNKKFEETNAYNLEWPERLHSASTFSSRIKSKSQTAQAFTCTRECQRLRILTVRNTNSAPNLCSKKEEDNSAKRSCTCVRVEKKESQGIQSARTTVSSTNLIKVPIQLAKKKSDPVSLYHYYMSLWAKYKTNVPGENNWADLRWQMRQKMANGDAPQRKMPQKPKRKDNEPIKKA